MTFQVPASKASFKQNRFEFELFNEYTEDGEPVVEKGSTVYSLPKMQYLNTDLRDRMMRASTPLKAIIDSGGQPTPEQSAEITAIQRELFERYAPGLYGAVSDDQLAVIQQAWQEASSISVGESSPSAD